MIAVSHGAIGVNGVSVFAIADPSRPISCLADWWFGNIPTDFHIFQRGWNQQPVSHCKYSLFSRWESQKSIVISWIKWESAMNKPQKIVDFHLGRLVAHLGHRLVEERRQVVFVEKVGMWLWCVGIEPIFPTSLCGVLVFDSVSRPAFALPPAPPPAPPSLSHTPSFHTQLCHKSSFTHTQLCHTPSFTHNFVTHHLSHTTLSHTIFPHTTLSHTIFHTQLCHTHHLSTHNFVTHHLSTHNFVTHHLSHTTLSHTIFHTQLCHTPYFHTQLCHTPSFTHNFVTHTIFPHTTLSHTIFPHTTLSHTIFHTQLCHTLSFRVAHLPSFCLADVALGAWQACHLWLWWRAWGPLVGDAALRGRRGTWRHLPSFCLAGVALGDIDLGERGTYGTGLALVARLGPLGRAVTPRHFAWQGWHLATSTVVLPGRCGTWWHLPAFSDTNFLDTTLLDTTNSHATYDVPFVWQGWHLATSTPTWGSFLDRPYIYISNLFYWHLDYITLQNYGWTYLCICVYIHTYIYTHIYTFIYAVNMIKIKNIVSPKTHPSFTKHPNTQAPKQPQVQKIG